MSTNVIPSTKPYLIRAIFEWCVENSFTPHILVQVDGSVRVPMAFVRDGRIVLNIAPYATHQLNISNDEITCQARFGGVAHSLFVPVGNVMAVYARENGQGMAFEAGPGASDAGVELHAGSDEQAADDDAMGQPPEDVAPDAPQPPDEPTPPVAPAGGRSHLRVIK
ncbi:ClpXP protease specificity-enhancing factor [Viridibacterium curvum]|uniref:ClpXP protease specificity-enhancing factor n=1 Tax=Viridibacterium curvum TaxID=1101404 RepID=A0ABP9QBV3_9RHOO